MCEVWRRFRFRNAAATGALHRLHGHTLDHALAHTLPDTLATATAAATATAYGSVGHGTRCFVQSLLLCVIALLDHRIRPKQNLARVRAIRRALLLQHRAVAVEEAARERAARLFITEAHAIRTADTSVDSPPCRWALGPPWRRAPLETADTCRCSG